MDDPDLPVKDGLEDKAARDVLADLQILSWIRRLRALTIACHMLLAANVAAVLASAAYPRSGIMEWLPAAIGLLTVPCAAIASRKTSSSVQRPSSPARMRAWDASRSLAGGLRRYAWILAIAGAANVAIALAT